MIASKMIELNDAELELVAGGVTVVGVGGANNVTAASGSDLQRCTLLRCFWG